MPVETNDLIVETKFTVLYLIEIYVNHSFELNQNKDCTLTNTSFRNSCLKVILCLHSKFFRRNIILIIIRINKNFFLSSSKNVANNNTP